LRYYTVFNVCQTCGIEIPGTSEGAFNPLQEAEQIIAGMPNPPVFEFTGNQPAYLPSRDLVRIPVRERFNGAEEFYSTMFHEITHSTGHATRLDRKGISESGVAFGSKSYSHEELVAEIGASFLNAKSRIVGATLENSTAYIASWLVALRNDKKMIISAAGHAQKATDYIFGVETSKEAQ
jgi:antirestriction protein ArdC